MKKFIGIVLVLCSLALPLAGCKEAISTVTCNTMSELEDIPGQMYKIMRSFASRGWAFFFAQKAKINIVKSLAHLCESDIITLIR